MFPWASTAMLIEAAELSAARRPIREIAAGR
jgi:hypothetical protein